MKKWLISFALMMVAAVSAGADVFNETLYPAWWQGFTVDNEIYRERSEVQDVRIFENDLFGKVMTLDGVVQLTAKDEFMYHEMLAHVPLFSHGNAKKVLIIGGGDGGVLREVLRHKDVEEVTLVDIDRSVIELSQEYFPEVSAGAFNDERVEVVIGDGAEFVKATEELFDVIICDSTDPIGPGAVLFTEEFYKNCSKILDKHGILVNQHGVPFLQMKELTDAYNRRLDHFKHVTFYTVSVPIYMGGMMTLGFATNSNRSVQMRRGHLRSRVQRFDGTFKYYSPEVHLAAFALPPYIKEGMKRYPKGEEKAPLEPAVDVDLADKTSI